VFLVGPNSEVCLGGRATKVNEEALLKHRSWDELMMMLLRMAGIGALLGGVVAILFGIPVKEFSFGNTLIVVGAMTACTGLIMIALSVVVGELKTIASRLSSRVTADADQRSVFAAGLPDPGENDFQFPRDENDLGLATPSVAPPVRNGTNAPLARQNGLSEPESLEAAPKPRRNLMFASTSRKERERAQTRSADVAAPMVPALPPMADANEPQPPGFDDAWATQGRLTSDMAPQRRAGRAPPVPKEPNAGVSMRNADQQSVTVLKSGVVDGMAYSLYSDGSIEAQMPEGLMRFASIDELRAHLDHRPG
jgi:hypothetical protein